MNKYKKNLTKNPDPDEKHYAILFHPMVLNKTIGPKYGINKKGLLFQWIFALTFDFSFLPLVFEMGRRYFHFLF